MKEVNLSPEIVFTIVLYENLIGEQFTFIYLEETLIALCKRNFLCGEAEVISLSEVASGSLLLQKFHAYYSNDTEEIKVNYFWSIYLIYERPL